MAYVLLSKGPLSPTATKHNHRGYPATAPNKKSQLKQKLGNPNCREKWLEGLAMAQSAETGCNAAKCLHHLLRMEEQ